MISKLICILWGHSFRAFTEPENPKPSKYGDVLPLVNYFCIRCLHVEVKSFKLVSDVEGN